MSFSSKIIFGLNNHVLGLLSISPFLWKILSPYPSNSIFIALLFVQAVVIFLWFWNLNLCTTHVASKNINEVLLVKIIVIFFVITSVLPYTNVTNIAYNSDDFEHKELILAAFSIVKLVIFLTLVILSTIRLKNILPERSVWFIVVELTFIILAIVNITPLLEESWSQNSDNEQ